MDMDHLIGGQWEACGISYHFHASLTCHITTTIWQSVINQYCFPVKMIIVDMLDHPIGGQWEDWGEGWMHDDAMI